MKTAVTRNNVYTVDQKGTYFQLRTVPLDRKVPTTTLAPQTLTGLEIQLSLTANCLFQNTSSDQQCTYTLTFYGYIAPIDETSNRSISGVTLTRQLQNKNNSPTLSLSWQNQEYDDGDDSFGNNLIVSDHIFTVLFRVGKLAK